jgi:hypothetical protein
MVRSERRNLIGSGQADKMRNGLLIKTTGTVILSLVLMSTSCNSRSQGQTTAASADTLSLNALSWNMDYATVKYDSSGHQTWVARYNGPGNADDMAYAMMIDKNGNIYVTGQSMGSESEQPGSISRINIIKILIGGTHD